MPAALPIAGVHLEPQLGGQGSFEQQMARVAAAIIENRGHVLLARRSFRGRLPGMWEFPGGKVEATETPEECLVREMAEELDIAVRVIDLFAQSTYKYDHGTFHVLAYWTEWLSGELHPRIHEAVEWVRIVDLNCYDLLPADVPIAAALASRFDDGVTTCEP